MHYIQKGFGEELRHSTVYHPDSQDCEDFGPRVDYISTPLLAEVRHSPSFTHAFENRALTVTNQALEFLVGVRL